MKMKKLCAITLAAAFCFSMAACSMSMDDGDATVVNIMNNGGGCGRIWLDEAIERFQAQIGEKSYAEGKKGVKFEIEHNINTSTATMPTSGYDIYFTTSDGYPRNLAQKGFLYDLTDFIEAKNYDNGTVSIKDKIDESYLDVLQGADGKYYAIPHEEWFPGLTYDADLFKERNLYIAADGAASIPYTCPYGTLNFVRDENAKKSCGNDGIYGTYDDGLPTSLTELLTLCAKMKEVNVTPFTVSGLNAQYTNYLTEALWASLSGYDEFRGTYAFDSKMNVVTGYSEDSLFPSVENAKIKAIKKPITQEVTLTEETGYLASNNVNKYYASVFLEVMYDEGWYSQSAGTQSTHTGEQSNFIFSGRNGKERVGFMIEGDYWFNESVTAGNFTDFKEMYPDEPDRDLRWMPLPTSFDQTTTEGNGRENILLDTGASFTFVNKKTAGKTDGCLNAVLDFLKFIYNDEEMSHFTLCTGLGKAAMKYEVTSEDKAQMQEFKKSIWDLRSNNKVVYGSAKNETFLNSPLTFVPYQNSESYFFYQLDGKLYICDLFANRAGYTARDCFEKARKTAEQWKGIYKGNKSL